MTAVDTQKFIKKALELIKKDKRTPLERGARKRPKVDFLNSISEVIVELFDNLFTVSDQVYLINTIDKKFSVSDTTYLKFLNENLKDEYDLYRKNRVFASNIYKIKEAFSLYPASAKIQFSAIFESNENVSFDDYQAFMQKYYYGQGEEFFKVHTVRKYDVNKKELVLRGNSGGLEYVTVSKRETFSDIAPKLKSLAAGGEDISVEPVKAKNSRAVKTNEVKKPQTNKNKTKQETVSSRNTKDKNGFNVYASHLDRDALRDKEGDFRIGLIAGADVHNPKPLFNIIEDRDNFPEEIMNAKFLLAGYNQQTLDMEESYVHLRDIDLIHYADPNTYGLIDGLLYVCETNYGKQNGYDFYRYYKGDIYFIENVYFIKGNATFQRSVTAWSYKNITGELEEFSQVVLDAKNQRKL